MSVSILILAEVLESALVVLKNVLILSQLFAGFSIF